MVQCQSQEPRAAVGQFKGRVCCEASHLRGESRVRQPRGHTFRRVPVVPCCEVDPQDGPVAMHGRVPVVAAVEDGLARVLPLDRLEQTGHQVVQERTAFEGQGRYWSHRASQSPTSPYQTIELSRFSTQWFSSVK